MAYVIEEEHGTFDGHVHQHNGYYAGDFWAHSQSATGPAPGPSLLSAAAA